LEVPLYRGGNIAESLMAEKFDEWSSKIEKRLKLLPTFKLPSAKFGKKWIRRFPRNYGYAAYAFRKNTGSLAIVPESRLKMERERLNKSGC
jgi:hypothetical protein